ncbi:helix-turn-helix domain-containing protein [Lutispora saccharofermentans]|uniref:Helix-turn-helix domain-containing protein n=1 Tax=Lutispora saccharofermentans TaxID=3024236 RepID=A0ABT1NHH3_9FIRM|nr:helix-turn-helix domain-containing protein [Lutispora saccharofermentans]
MVQLDSLGKRITYLRTKNNLTQKDLMELLNFDNLSRYENDERKPSLNIIIELAKHFNVSTDWLLLGESLNESKSDFFDSNIKLSVEERNLLCLFNQLSDLEKGIIIGRMEEMIKNHSR